VGQAAVAAAPPAKPTWPVEFDSPFGLTNLFPKSPILNVTSHFYYNWDQYQSQVIDYPNRCIPGLEKTGETYPCKLYFNPQGVYLSQPALNITCCQYFAGVGAVPPTFLEGMTWNSQQTASDYYGYIHQCDYWTGDLFAYWTDSQSGFDVLFQDGPSGTFWGWGEFNVNPQSKSIFTLPASNSVCNKKCPGVLLSGGSDEAILQRLVDAVPLVRFAQRLDTNVK